MAGARVLLDVQADLGEHLAAEEDDPEVRVQLQHLDLVDAGVGQAPGLRARGSIISPQRRQWSSLLPAASSSRSSGGSPA